MIRRAHQSGFTLIELMVVLVILGLVMALVLPKFPAIYAKFVDKGDRDSFNQNLGSLSVKAYTQQKQILLAQDNLGDYLELPSGWKVKIDQPIIYKANGVCLGGQLKLTIKQLQETIELRPPFCRPESR